MSSYDFKNLSFADFEDLSRDLIGRARGIKFEGFSVGPDGGMDGRHSLGKNVTILQAKHYSNSSFSSLKNRMRREQESIRKLNPTDYILTTSHPLTPSKKEKLIECIGDDLIKAADILGPVELNSLLKDFPCVEKSHIKLWLSSTGVLERIIRSASLTYNNITLEDIESKLSVYAQNPSLDQGREILEQNHVLIVSGPPGVGKTTLAEMLSFAYISEDWELRAMRSLDDGFDQIEDSKKQIFLFDDFLGRVALDKHALSQKDSDLHKFISRVCKSKNARFVLTTRAYIFEEARRCSEYLSGRLLDISKYTLDVGVYTRQIRARILYNHLVKAQAPRSFVSQLLDSRLISKIVDHVNYNPRIIEWMTDETRYGAITAESYPEYFINTLDNPSRLWDTPFRDHIASKCQNLLITLFFCSEYGVSIKDLEIQYNSLHSYLSKKYGAPYGPKDFEESVKILEGSFIKISNKTVNFVNPSVRDYLDNYLRDLPFLLHFPQCSILTDWARNLWKFIRDITNEMNLPATKYALSFKDSAKQFLSMPTIERVETSYGYSFQSAGLSNTERISLLLEWWDETNQIEFESYAALVAENPVSGLDSWRDGSEVIELIYDLKQEHYYSGLNRAEEIASYLEASFLAILDKSMVSDELEAISDAINRWPCALSEETEKEFIKYVETEFNNVHYTISDIDSESTVEDQIRIIEKVGRQHGISSHLIDEAVCSANDRLHELQKEEEEVASAPNFSNNKLKDDRFEDDELDSLFKSLLDTID